MPKQPKPVTANQLKAQARQVLKDEGVGNPILMAFLMPIIMKLIESWLAKYDVTPKAEA